MAIDYNKIEQAKQEFNNSGGTVYSYPKYQNAFVEWLRMAEDTIEADIQQYLEESVKNGENDLNIKILADRSDQNDDSYRVGIIIGGSFLVSPALIFTSYQTMQMFERHVYSEEEMKKIFEWYCNKFAEVFDSIGLKYKADDIFVSERQYSQRIYLLI